MASLDPDHKDIEVAKDDAAMIAAAPIEEINSEARKAFEAEHALRFSEAIKLYPAAVGWALFFSLGVIM
jgi:hypothetical protein